MQTILSNEFIVLVLDALLHFASVVVLGLIVVLACKVLSKGFVEAKLLTGLMVATLLVLTRVFLLNNIHHVLGGVDIIIIMTAVAIALFLTSLLLVYKLVAIPIIGSALSSIAIVAAQLVLAHYTPVLSLKLMPEGQRFAEYAGVANDRTKQLMVKAKAFQGQSGSIKEIIQRALASIAFFTSKDEQENLSRDFASGIRLYKERKAYMDSLSDEELAEYRAVMSQFLQEQGLAGAESRYSLENLKSAKPEDLENLANFMQDMNQVYGFTDDMPETQEGEELPPTAESLRQITVNMRAMNLEGGKNPELKALLTGLMESESFSEGLIKAKAQLDELRANSGQLLQTFSGANLDAMREKLQSAASQKSEMSGINLNPEMPFYPKYDDLPRRGDPVVITAAGPQLNPYSADSALLNVIAFEDMGYIPLGYLNRKKAQAGGSVNVGDIGSNDATYYMPVPQFSKFMEWPILKTAKEEEPAILESVTTAEDESDYFSDQALTTNLTKAYVLKIPKGDSDESQAWSQVGGSIPIDAWFEGTDEENLGTIFVDGIAYRSGEKIEREHKRQIYYFRFEGVLDGQIVIRALKCESTKQ